MLRRIDLTGATGAPAATLLPRAPMDVDAAVAAIAALVHGVRERGYPAAREATARYDGVDVAQPAVPAAAIADSLRTLAPPVADALQESIRRARIGHEAQVRTTVRTQIVAGGVVTEKWVPMRRVGLYV
ncbi:MAG: histidinol dehydrogenase, partial [Actinomycetota bacterium]|nr:histidinol dehydrogenase [Actinomycetota bacterium]